MIFTSRPSAWGLIIGPVAAVGLLVPLVAVAAPAHAAFPGANGKIAFYGDAPCCATSVYTIAPDGTGQTQLLSSGAENPSWSADGARIAFDVGGTDVYVANSDGTGQVRLASGRDPTWGQSFYTLAIAFEEGSPWPGISRIFPDGTNYRVVTSGRPCAPGQDGWYYEDPAGSYSSDVAFSKTLVRWDADLGTCVTGPTTIGSTALDYPSAENVLTSGPDDRSPDLSPSGGFKVVFVRSGELWLNTSGGTDLNIQGFEPAWSPDGTKIVFSKMLADGQADLFVVNADGTGETRLTDNPSYSDLAASWRADNPAPYTRPVGTGISRLSLGPTFRPCAPGSTNASHGSALAGASCNPPTPSSAQVAVGSRSLGYTQWRALAKGQCAGFDSTRCYPDIAIIFDITDVRSGSPSGPDYDSDMFNWDLTGTASQANTANGAVVLTDMYSRSNGDYAGGFEGPYDKSATRQPFGPPYAPLRIQIDCVPTSDPTVGSVCSTRTTANALMPGVAVAGKRAIWDLGQLQVLDQGADGVPGDNDDQLFEAQGVFIP